MSSRASIPLADAVALRSAARWTRIAQVALAAAAVGLAALATVVALRVEPAGNVFAPPSTSGIVVLDLSASISSETYDRIAATLDRLADSGGRYGLVLFSDVAYQALPPGTRSEELRPFLRFFQVPRRSGGGIPAPPRSPWNEAFSSGTVISTGLVLALDTIRQQRLRDPSVVLVSDLDDDSTDLQRLTDVALAYRRDGIPLHVVGLDPAPEDEQFVRNLVARQGTFVEAPIRESDGRLRAGVAQTATLTTAAVFLALALALFLPATERLSWRRRP